MFEQFVKWKYGMFGDVFSHLSEVVFVDDISNMACFWWMEILMFLLKVKKSVIWFNEVNNMSMFVSMIKWNKILIKNLNNLFHSNISKFQLEYFSWLSMSFLKNKKKKLWNSPTKVLVLFPRPAKTSF